MHFETQEIPRSTWLYDAWNRPYAQVWPRGVQRRDWGHAAPFVRFDTGEVVCSHLSDKDVRGRYRELGLTVVLTSVDTTEPLYHNGEKVPLTWLNFGGGTTLVIDHDWGRVYQPHRFRLVDPLFSACGDGAEKARIARKSEAFATGVPANLIQGGNVIMYWPGEYQEPRACAPIRLAKPVKLNADEAKQLKALQAVCKMRIAMGVDKKYVYETYSLRRRDIIGVAPEDIAGQPAVTRSRLAQGVWDTKERDFEDVPYLSLSKTES